MLVNVCVCALACTCMPLGREGVSDGSDERLQGSVRWGFVGVDMSGAPAMHAACRAFVSDVRARVQWCPVDVLRSCHVHGVSPTNLEAHPSP